MSAAALEARAIYRGLMDNDELAINAAIDFSLEQGWPKDQVSLLEKQLICDEDDQISPDIIAMLFITFWSANVERAKAAQTR